MADTSLNKIKEPTLLNGLVMSGKNNGANLAFPLLNFGELCYNMGKYDEAKKCFVEASSLSKENSFNRQWALEFLAKAR